MNQSNDNQIRVWDLPTRLFHWLLVALIIASYVTYEMSYMEWHMRSGLTILSLVLFRVIWGVIGSTTSRFSHFLKGPGTVRQYLNEHGSAPWYGHNPIGGWSVVAFLCVLLIEATLGLFSNDEFYFEGPLVQYIDHDLSDQLSGYHEFSFNILMALVVIHICANLYYLYKKNNNLIKPMISGRRAKEAFMNESTARFRSPWVAFILFGVVAVGVFSLLGQA